MQLAARAGGRSVQLSVWYSLVACRVQGYDALLCEANGTHSSCLSKATRLTRAQRIHMLLSCMITLGIASCDLWLEHWFAPLHSCDCKSTSLYGNFLCLGTPPAQIDLRKSTWEELLCGMIATVLHNRLCKRLFENELRTFWVTQHGRVCGLCSRQWHRIGPGDLLPWWLLIFCRSHPPKLIETVLGESFCATLGVWSAAMDVKAGSPSHCTPYIGRISQSWWFPCQSHLLV